LTGALVSPAFEAVARWVRGVTHAMLAIAAMLFCVALAGLAGDIVMRYLFDSSIRGMQEIVNLLFSWIYMLGIAALYARKGDAAITFIARSLPVRLQIGLSGLVALIIAASMIVVVVCTIELITAQTSIRSAELGIPEPLRFAPLAIAAGCIALTGLIDLWSCVLWARIGVRPMIWREALHPI
jgi:TRAP-type C4-dicarboxylate transport system permease small subunit